MNHYLTAGLLFAASLSGADNAAVTLAKRCMANTAREGIKYTQFPTPYASGLKSCRASYKLPNGSTLGLSVLAPEKDGRVNYATGLSSMIVSLNERGSGMMYTDVFVDGVVDMVSAVGGRDGASAEDSPEKLQARYTQLVQQWLQRYK
jgi:hypothetical protein